MPAPATPDPTDDELAPLLTVDDLKPFADIAADKAAEMVNGAIAVAVLVAPCIGADTFTDPVKRAAVKEILRDAVLRRNDAGSGALQTRLAGPFQNVVDTRQPRRTMFWPSEIEQLQGICRGDTGTAFGIDTDPGDAGVVHADICAINFGANYCSCMAVITGRLPLYEESC